MPPVNDRYFLRIRDTRAACGAALVETAPIATDPSAGPDSLRGRSGVSYAFDLIVSDLIAHAPRELLEEVLAAWPANADPDAPAPIATISPLSNLIARGPERERRTRPVLVVLADDEPTLHLYQLADHLHESLRPGMLLMKDPTPDLLRLTEDGLIVDRLDIPPASIATTLRTLSARQAVVTRLSNDLRVASVTMRGTQSEMAKLQAELQHAAAVQREFIPHAPAEVPGIDSSAVYRPAGYVSGDVFDVVALDDEHVGFFVADAVGHGVPAALLTLVIARGLRPIPGREMGTPAEALARLNTELTERPGPGQRFATAVCGVLNTHTGELVLASAGHPPPLLSREGAPPEALDVGGPMLGVFAGAEFEETTLKLEPGELLMLYSDGLEVAFPDPEATGDALKLPSRTYLDRLAEAAAEAHSRGHAREAADVFGRRLDASAGSLHQNDDITALFLRWAPETLDRSGEQSQAEAA